MLWLKLFSLFLLGIIFGFCIFLLLPHAPLSIDNPVLSSTGIHRPRIIGFLPYFLSSRATNNYNPYLTTTTYFGFTIGSDGHIVKLTTPQQEDPGWYDLQTDSVQKKLQDAKNNHETLSLSVAQADEATISALMQNPKQNANNLLADVAPVMKKYGFTDLNIDVESFLPPDANKQKNFTIFVQTIKNEMKNQHLGTVSIDIPAIAFVKTNIIKPVDIGNIVDFAVVMAYDYHTVVSSNTGPVAPIGGANIEAEYDVTNAIAIAKQEINPQKIILGIPLYGYEWDTLSSAPGAATIPNTGQTASNRRISTIFTSSCSTCTTTKDSLAEETDFVYQEKSGDPYFHQSFLLDENDLASRVTFAQQNNLAGVALWALGYEGNNLLNPLSSYKTSTLTQ